MAKKSISRKKVDKIVKGKKTFSWDYFDQQGKPIANQQIIDRCNKLVLPPAWAATWKTASRLSEQLDPDSVTERKKVLLQVIKTVSPDLGNTPTVCRSSCIHPAIISDWEAGSFRKKWNECATSRKIKGLSKDETATLVYIE